MQRQSWALDAAHESHDCGFVRQHALRPNGRQRLQPRVNRAEQLPVFFSELPGQQRSRRVPVRRCGEDRSRRLAVEVRNGQRRRAPALAVGVGLAMRRLDEQ